MRAVAARLLRGKVDPVDVGESSPALETSEIKSQPSMSISVRSTGVTALTTLGSLKARKESLRALFAQSRGRC